MSTENTDINPGGISYEDLDFSAGYGEDPTHVLDDDQPKKDDPTGEGEANPSGEGDQDSTVATGDDDNTGEGDDDSTTEDVVEEDPTIIGELGKLLEVDLDDPTKYSEDLEGIAQMVLDLLPKGIEDGIQERYSNHPEALEYLKYLEQGGNPTEFFGTMHPEIDYAQVEITENNITTQEEIVRANLKYQGLDDETINKFIDSTKSGGNLKQTAEVAQQALVKLQQQEKEALAKQIAEQESAQKAQRDTMMKDVDSVLQKGVVQNIQIPIPQREELKEYLFNPIDQTGTTQYLKDLNELSMEQQVFLAYLTKNSLDLPKLVKNMVKTSKAQDLKDLLLKKKQAKNAGDVQPKGVPTADVNVDNLLI